MSEEKTFSREEVVDLLTILHKTITFKFSGDRSCFPWEKHTMPFHIEGSTMYGTIFGQVMSLIESTVEKEKIEPTKTIARQLLSAEQNKQYTNVQNLFCDIVNNEEGASYGDHWDELNKKLNK